MTLTIEQQTGTLAQYLPGGRAFGSKDIPNSVLRSLLSGLAQEIYRADGYIDLLRTDVVPDNTVFFIDEWESALGIPDDCFNGQGTDSERRLDIIVKLASMGIQSEEDFEALALKYGVVVDVVPGKIAEAEPSITFPDDKTARHTIVINFLTAVPTKFTYTFPINFGTEIFAILECLFTKLKPANCDLLFTSY